MNEFSRSKLLVFGYVRLNENIINLFSIIPISIIILIYEYQYIFDSWNIKCINKHFKIIDEYTIKTTKNIIMTAYGNKIIKFGEYYHWKIKITSPKKWSISYWINI